MEKTVAPDIRIRRAQTEDAAVVAQLTLQLGHPIEGSSTLQVASQLIGDPHHLVLVADRDGQVVGFLNLNLRPQLHHGGLVGTIDEMVVDNALRGGGIGARLVDAAIKHAADVGADAIDVITGLQRVETQRFYQTHGFQHVAHMLVNRLRVADH